MRPDETGPAAISRCQSRHIPAVEDDRSGTQRKGAGQRAQQRRLAGSIRADNTNRIAISHGKIKIFEDHKRSEALADPPGRQEILAWPLSFLFPHDSLTHYKR